MNLPSKLMRYSAIGVLVLALGSTACNRDPNYAKQQYVTSGNKYYDRGRYKEALIMYRKALSKDPKYGEAYYRLARTYQAMGQNANLVSMLRRATELLPAGTPEWNESALKLGEILVQAAVSQDVPGRNKPLLDEVNQLQATLDAKAPNSFEALRLKAEVLRADAAQGYARQDSAAVKSNLEDSIAALRKSLQARPSDAGTSIALARELSMTGQTAEAEKIYRGLISGNKKDPLPYVELYRILMSQKRTGEAEALLKEAVSSNPKDFSFRTMLAAYYFSQGNRAEMARILNDMKANAKDFPQAYLTAGDFYARIRDLDTSFQQFQEGEQKDPGKKAEYQKREVEILLRQNKRDAAYAKTLEILKDNPKDPDARGLQADFMLDRGEVDQAVTQLQDVVTAKPDNFVARFNLGRAYAAKGNYQQAIQQYRESIKTRPDYLRPRLALAEADMQVGDFDGALKTAQDTSRMSPNNPAALLLEGTALARLNRIDEARKVLTDVVTRFPQFPEGNLELAALNARAKDYGAAQALFHKAYQQNPKDLRALVGEAETFFALKQPDKALALLQGEVASHPERSDLLREYASMKARAGQYDSALTDYRTLLDRFKDKPKDTAQIDLAIGQLYLQKGDTNAAVDWMQKARALDGANPAVLNLLAEQQMKLGRTNDAVATYRAALATASTNPAALNNLAFAIAESGTNLDEALTYATKAKQQLPDVKEIDDTIGWIYIKKQMPDSAIEVFKRLTAGAPENPTFHYHYCLALYGKGDKDGAQKECNAALARNPGKSDADGARQMLAKLR